MPSVISLWSFVIFVFQETRSKNCAETKEQNDFEVVIIGESSSVPRWLSSPFVEVLP